MRCPLSRSPENRELRLFIQLGSDRGSLFPWCRMARRYDIACLIRGQFRRVYYSLGRLGSFLIFLSFLVRLSTYSLLSSQYGQQFISTSKLWWLEVRLLLEVLHLFPLIPRDRRFAYCNKGGKRVMIVINSTSRRSWPGYSRSHIFPCRPPGFGHALPFPTRSRPGNLLALTSQFPQAIDDKHSIFANVHKI